MKVEKLKNSCRKRYRELYNLLIKPKKDYRFLYTDLRELKEIKERSRIDSSINEHLVTLFIESLAIRPKLLVELGVGGGASTFVLERVARLCDSILISVDITDRSHLCALEKWIFIKKDDIAFAQEFKDWCAQKGLEPQIDVLFIDTSHLYEHTVQEIRSYFPYLAAHAKVFFHDTNLSTFFFRKDGTMDIGWNNDRGVIRAIEEFLQRSFNEKEEFVDFIDPWLIKHYPYCSGFTILEKIPLEHR